MIVNGYKNEPSTRLRISWKWPESVFLVLTERKADSVDEIDPTHRLFHNGCQIKYSSVLVIISISNLVTTSKFKKKIASK